MKRREVKGNRIFGDERARREECFREIRRLRHLLSAAFLFPHGEIFPLEKKEIKRRSIAQRNVIIFPVLDVARGTTLRHVAR